MYGGVVVDVLISAHIGGHIGGQVTARGIAALRDFVV